MPLQQMITNGHPDVLLIIEALAHGYILVYQLGHAVDALEDLLRRDPEHGPAHFWRGRILEDANRINDAIPEYRRAVELVPRRTTFRLRLALALVRNGQANEAWPHVEELLQITPADADLLLAAARCQRSFGDCPRAVDYLETLIRDHPDLADAWDERGRVALVQGNGSEAVRFFRRAFQLDPLNSDTGFALYTELNGQKKHDEAKVVWESLHQLKRDQDELALLIREVGKDERNAPLRHKIGVLLLKNKGDTAALRWFAGALQADPDYRPTHAVLADYHERKGNAELAAFHRGKAGKTTP